MKYNNALGILACGLALTALTGRKGNRLDYISLAAFVMGALTMVPYIFPTSWNIDSIFMQPFANKDAPYVMRMAPPSAISLD